MIDYHVHPDYSPDARGTMAEFCLRAVQQGISELCFTTHWEPDPARAGIERVRVRGELVRPDADWAGAYFAEVGECRREFPGLVVRAGVEVGYEMGLEGAIADFLGRWPFDFVLGAVHLLEHVAITAGDELATFRERLKPRGPGYVAARYAEYIRAAAGSGLFDCLAHLDVWRKYIEPEMGEGFSRAVEPLVEPMVRSIAGSGTGLEVNASALRRGQPEPYPAESILRLALRHSVSTFTLGSDAHSPDAVGGRLADGLALLRRLGVEPARFERRRRV